MVRKVRFVIVGAVLLLLSACHHSADITISISDEVVNSGYIGNGVEWDPYDEALAWGHEISDEQWQTLFHRLDVMRPQYVRCMINSPFSYWDAEKKTYRKGYREANIRKLLGYCKEHHITVLYGEFNPPTWDMKQSQEWIDMSVDYLNYLINDCDLTCIKYFVIFNEPDGDWASTNGDYDMWLSMLKRFHKKMSAYDGLLDKVSLAGPDAVVNYKNSNSKFDTQGWLSQSVADADSIIGIYDVHAYPGQHEVRSGKYSDMLKRLSASIPEGKKIILGEAGFKYDHPEDSLLKQEYNRRAEANPFTKGSDCNMLCYDYFYGLDMPMFAMEAMNSGMAGLALWMLDDAMHSSGDSGKIEDVKIWGLWNILGGKVFNKAEEESPRPLYYSWTLMCRYFPQGCNILKNSSTSLPEKGLFTVCAEKDGKLSFAVVNVGNEDQQICVAFPHTTANARLYTYQENNCKTDQNGEPLPVEEGISTLKYDITVKAQTMSVLTEM